jgi:hypothetical protein
MLTLSIPIPTVMLLDAELIYLEHLDPVKRTCNGRMPKGCQHQNVIG